MKAALVLFVTYFVVLWFSVTAKADTTQTKKAICGVFGAYCSQALRVAFCESGYNVWARNGQYLGLFQMGYTERKVYGHSWDAWGQARAAYRYFVASGRDWSPWSCRPW